MDWDVRLLVDDYYTATVSTRYENLYIKDELGVGRVEVCLNGGYRPLCQRNELWNNQSVSVVCRQLGFSPYGELQWLSTVMYYSHSQ